MASKQTDAWKQLRELTLQNLDIRRVYEEFGVKFTGKISASNWAECHAFGRDDASPSAAVNLSTGVYKDFAGERFSIFDFMAHHNICDSWQTAQDELARKAGLGAKIPKKKKAKRPEEVLGFTKTFSLASVVPLARKYGIKPEVIGMIGARMARYPANSPEPQMVCAFPIFSPVDLLDKPPESWVLQSGSGHPVMVYQGPDIPAKPEKRIVIGTTGILNRWALEHWEEAERVYKVEGLSDLMAMQHFIPEELRKKHVVITNACGADDGAPAWELAPHLIGKEFVIIHDADVPGQFGTSKDRSGGAQRWIAATKSTAKTVRNVQLPYEVELKHGKDLRDWLQEPGRVYSDLLELVNKTPDQATGLVDDGTGATRTLTKTEQILDRLGITVLGYTTNRTKSITCFNRQHKRQFDIPDITKWAYLNALQELGDVARDNITEDPDKHPVLLTMKEVKEALAYESAHKILDKANTIGVGIWQIGGKLAMVGAGQWLLMNGSLASFEAPSVAEKLIEFGSKEKSWYEELKIREYLPHATDAAWRSEFLKEFIGIFRRWDNWATTPEEQDLRAELVTCLVLATWVQDIWGFRPWVAITGEANSGKSALFSFLNQYFGKLVAIFGVGTEAGIRQQLGNTSGVLLLDEFETSPQRDKTLDWLKNSGGGASVVRGTPGHSAVSMSVKVLPWMGATEAGMKRETERSRYIVFSLNSRVDMERFTLPTESEIEELKHKSLAILLRVWSRAKELEAYLCHHHAIKGVSHRYTETHAIPVALHSAILGEDYKECSERFSRVMAPMLSHILFTTEAEHTTLVESIATAQVNIGRGEHRTVSDLLTSTSHSLGNGETPDAVLARFGIRKMLGSDFRAVAPAPEPNQRYIFLAHKVVLRELLRHSEYSQKGIDQLLRRVRGAFTTQQRVGTVKSRGIAIPMEAMISLDVINDPTDGFVPEEHRRTISSDVF